MSDVYIQICLEIKGIREYERRQKLNENRASGLGMLAHTFEEGASGAREEEGH